MAIAKLVANLTQEEKLDREIIDFIKRRFPIDCKWLNGNCYWFALILSNRFPVDIFYLPKEGHFVAGAHFINAFYDWSGRVYPEEEPLLLVDIMAEDPVWYNRLMRDCAN